MPPKRQGWIDVAKGLAILLVVMHHSNNFLKHRSLDASWWNTFDVALQHFRMPLFFLASGVVAVSAVARSWRSLVRTRLLLLVWLVTAWSTVYFLLSQLQPRIGNSRGVRTTVGELVFELVRPITEIWYLQALVAFLVLARLTRRLPTPLVLAAATVLSVAVGSWVVDTGNFALDSMGANLVFFLVGLRGRDVVTDAVGRVRPWHAAAAVTVFVAAAAVVQVTDTWSHPVTVLPLSVLGVLAGVATAARLAPTSPGRVLVTIGRQTLPVYLTHVSVIGLVVLVWSSVSGPASAPVAAVSPVVLAVAVVTVCLGFAPLIGRVPGALAVPSWLCRLFDATARHPRALPQRRGEEATAVTPSGAGRG